MDKAIAELFVALFLQLLATTILIPWTRYHLNLSLPVALVPAIAVVLPTVELKFT